MVMNTENKIYCFKLSLGREKNTFSKEEVKVIVHLSEYIFMDSLENLYIDWIKINKIGKVIDGAFFTRYIVFLKSPDEDLAKEILNNYLDRQMRELNLAYRKNTGRLHSLKTLITI